MEPLIRTDKNSHIVEVLYDSEQKFRNDELDFTFIEYVDQLYTKKYKMTGEYTFDRLYADLCDEHVVVILFCNRNCNQNDFVCISKKCASCVFAITQTGKVFEICNINHTLMTGHLVYNNYDHVFTPSGINLLKSSNPWELDEAIEQIINMEKDITSLQTVYNIALQNNHNSTTETIAREDELYQAHGHNTILKFIIVILSLLFLFKYFTCT